MFYLFIKISIQLHFQTLVLSSLTNLWNRSQWRWRPHHGHGVKNRWRTYASWCHQRIHHRRHVRWHIRHAWTWWCHVRWWNRNASWLATRCGSCKRIVCNLSGLKRSCSGINEMLCLLFHPFLVVELHIVAMLASCTVCFAHRGWVVRQICIAVVAIVLGHTAARQSQQFIFIIIFILKQTKCVYSQKWKT